jgi:rubrerythrin
MEAEGRGFHSNCRRASSGCNAAGASKPLPRPQKELFVSLDIFQERGIPLEKQAFTWRELAGKPYSKLDVDAFTRVRVIFMNGIESEQLRFLHVAARMNAILREPLAMVRRAEQHQQTLVNWLNPADQSPLETTLGYEQVAIEMTADIAQKEPDPYLAQVHRLGLLEDFDHLYRYAALYDRLEGGDANNITQSYTDIRPGRPTKVEHRHPLDDLRRPYDRKAAHPLSKLHAYTLTAAEHQTHDYYMHVGPFFTDPVARQLYAEIASIEEQHVTQYESLLDPDEGWLEKWLLHEACEVYNYWGCFGQESHPRIKMIWERLLQQELGHLAYVRQLFEQYERRDASEVLPKTLPDPIRWTEHREFVRDTLRKELDFRASGKEIVPLAQDPQRSIDYRAQLNRDGSPSETIAAGYVWRPGTELAPRALESIHARRLQ